MLEIITKFGAVIHIDEKDPRQTTMVAVAAAAFGGIDFQMPMIVPADEKTAE